MSQKIRFPSYFETKEGILCHTVSENCYYKNNYIIGLPKYFPTNHLIDGSRVYKGRPYLDHLPTFQDSLERMRTLNNDSLKYLPQFGEELCIFDQTRDIKEVFEPKTMARDIYFGNVPIKDEVLKDAQKLLHIIVEYFEIDISCLGVEGSILLGCYKKSSDIDMVVYGKENGEKIVDNFHKLSSVKEIHLYDMSDLDLIFSRRFKYRSFTSNQELLEQELKRTVGLINNRRFWIQPLLSEDTPPSLTTDREIHRVNIVEDIFTIKDAIYSKFWPALYSISNRKYGEILLECYDPIYMNQASKGDKIAVRGTLYINSSSDTRHIILAPWIASTQILRRI